jgi:hypothetical protein
MLAARYSESDPKLSCGQADYRTGVYRTGPVLVRSCRYRRTCRPSPAQDGARVAAAAGEC